MIVLLVVVAVCYRHYRLDLYNKRGELPTDLSFFVLIADSQR